VSSAPADVLHLHPDSVDAFPSLTQQNLLERQELSINLNDNLHLHGHGHGIAMGHEEDVSHDIPIPSSRAQLISLSMASEIAV
jgi:hypothetical protein